jgi:predicted enzyme related to lactoylglutathione lyase
MSRVVHFEIHAENPERAIAFYHGLFGWKIARANVPMEYWLVETGPDGTPGINGGLLRRHGPSPVGGECVNAYVCTVGVDSLDACLAKLPAAGGTQALPKMAIPGVGWLAYAKDTEGNIFGMMQPDTSAS